MEREKEEKREGRGALSGCEGSESEGRGKDKDGDDGGKGL